jgi:hypothetical protein
MPKRLLLLAVLAVLCGAVATLALDRYLFVRRITHIDPKTIYHQIQALTAARGERERTAAIASAEASPELRSYRIALVADHIVVLHTHSLATDAYLTFHQLGDSNAWVLGWLRHGRYWQIGTDRF